MANKFNIVISATDKATAVVKKFKNEVSKITRPFRETVKSVKKLGKELGLDKLAKGFVGVTKFAAGAATKILGVGAALAGVAVAGGAVAITAMARDWTFMGTQVLNTAGIIGDGAKRLQVMSGAARVFGLDVESMTGGLKTLGDTMEDAFYGRNQDALVMLNRLHISIKRTKNGAIDTEAAFLDIAKAITKIKNVQAQGLVARTFGLEALLPMLQKGPEGIKQVQKLVEATNAALDEKKLGNMSKFQQHISLLQESVEGLGNALALKLLPNIDPATQDLTKLIQKMTDATEKGKLLSFTTHQTQSDLSKVANSDIHWWDFNAILGPFLALKMLNRLGVGEQTRDPKAAPGGGGMPHMRKPFNLLPSEEGPDGFNEQRARAALQKLFPGVNITGGQRTPFHNWEVGGVWNSDHLSARALDFKRPAGQDRSSIEQALRAAHLPIKQLLDEGNHMHWAWPKADGRSALHMMLQDQGAGGGPANRVPMQNAGEQTHVVVEFKNAPPGTRANVVKAGPMKTTLKIGYALPDLASP